MSTIPTNYIPDLIKMFSEEKVEQLVEYVMTYFANHVKCILFWKASIILDQDGMWCSVHETDVFEISLEEMRDRGYKVVIN